VVKKASKISSALAAGNAYLHVVGSGRGLDEEAGDRSSGDLNTLELLEKSGSGAHWLAAGNPPTLQC
jgi:hypothetical protein